MYKFTERSIIGIGKPRHCLVKINGTDIFRQKSTSSIIGSVERKTFNESEFSTKNISDKLTFSRHFLYSFGGRWRVHVLKACFIIKFDGRIFT